MTDRGGSKAAGAPPRARALPPWLDRALAMPLAIPAAVTGVAFVAGIVGLVQVGHPEIGDTTGIDGQAVWLGNWLLFRDPAEGYTAAGYTPLLPYLVGLLDHITVWRGWGSLLNVLASGALAIAAARLAWSPRGDQPLDRALAVIEAAGIGALVWWVVSTGYVETFQGDRPDQFAWTLALLGLLFVPAAARGSKPASWLAIGLLSAGFWTKQPALAVAGAAGVFLLIAVLAKWTTLRRAAMGVAIFALVNAAIMGVLTLLTDGWEFYFNLYLPATVPVCCELSNEPGDYVRLFTQELFASAYPLLWFAGGLGAIAIAGRLIPFFAGRGRRSGDPDDRAQDRRPGVLHRARRSIEGMSPDGQVTLSLVVFSLLGIVAAAWARKGIGSAVNQSLGVVWAVAMLGAVAYRSTRARRGTAIAATAVVLALIAASFWSRGTVSFGKYDGRFSSLDVAMEWEEIPEPIVAYARDRSVYHPAYSDLSVTGEGTIYPNWITLTGLMLSDLTPEDLETAIVERRFDTVWQFSRHKVDHPLSNLVEENYIWKLNELMALKYPVTGDAPAGGRDRGTGEDPAPWVNGCVGPFDLAGVEFRQQHGGGFWCQRGDRLTIDRLPPGVDVSDVHTVDPITGLEGTLHISWPSGPEQFEVFADLDGQLLWRIQGVPKSGRLTVTGQSDGRDTDPVELRGSRSENVAIHLAEGDVEAIELRPAPDGVEVTVPQLPAGARLNLAARRGSATGFDLAELNIGQ